MCARVFTPDARVALENTKRIQPAMTFKPGKSGNPAGKPPGAKNKNTLAVEALLNGEAETLTRKAIELAKTGDMAALRLCLDRIAPARKDRPIYIRLPPLSSAEDAVRAAAAIVEALGKGKITPSEAADVGKMVDNYVNALKAADLDDRLKKLEKAVS
jgi:hypothetical protein